MTESILIGYRIFKDGGELLSFDVEIDNQNHSKQPPKNEGDNENWARLGNHQCEHCPLSPPQESQCPIALRIASVTVQDQHAISTEVVECKVETP